MKIFHREVDYIQMFLAKSIARLAGGFLFSLLAVALAFPTLQAADPAKTKDASSVKKNAIDNQLRNSLDDDLLKDLPVAPKKKTDSNAKTPASPDRKEDGTTPVKPKTALDSKLLDELEGEDIELKKAPDPLTQIGKRMRKVEGLIQQRDTSRDTQEMQRQIATDLDSLIEQLQKQSKGSGSKASKSGQASNSSGTGNAKPSQRPASESTQRVGKSVAQTDSAEEKRKMMKEIWGHLPARIRDQMQNISEEQFLPQYEKLIEEYYRRLAEQGAKTP